MTMGPESSVDALQPGLVTIAIPTFNGARWLPEAIASAMEQTYARIEILVVDDASDDDSAEIAASTGDDRVRVVRNERRLGLARNWNRCIADARGEYLKFVFQDDLLDPACVEELVTLMRESLSVGLAFTPRTIALEEPDDPAARRWAARFSQPHRRFGSLKRVNPGRDLFDRQLSRSPFRNWIGEPSVVLLRTDLVRTLGGFNERLHQLVDADMWLRLMFHADVGFIDRPLATFRIHGASATVRHASTGADWLDPLWMVEGLLADDEISAARPRIAWLRARGLARVVRGEVGRIGRRRYPAILSRRSELGSYFGYLQRRHQPAKPGSAGGKHSLRR